MLQHGMIRYHLTLSLPNNAPIHNANRAIPTFSVRDDEYGVFRKNAQIASKMLKDTRKIAATPAAPCRTL